MATLRNSAIAIAAATLLFSTVSALADHHFAGTWLVKDSNGADFEITLTEGGKASADRGSEGMSGTWNEEGGEAVIKWNTGWTTKIAKDGDGYKKTAFEGDTEKNTSVAKKK